MIIYLNFCGIEADPNLEMFHLWQNWKDHWFYVVGRDFAPDASDAPSVPCTNCPQFDGGARYSALLIFSEQRINNQLRRTDETEDPALINIKSKAELANYLEGNNLFNDGDPDGNGNYDSINSNDRLFCVPQDMTPPATVNECTP